MVKIRLTRNGSKRHPFYQVVVTDSRNARDGLFIERLGFLNPIAADKTKSFKLNLNRVNYWINNGAITSKRVLALIKNLKKI